MKKKYFEVDIPMINEKAEVLANSIEEVKGKTIKIDTTRILKGKSSEMVFFVKMENGKLIGEPKRLSVLSFFIRHMLHTGVDYIEDSFIAPSQEGNLVIKPFLITRKKVSRAVKRTLRNSAKNFIGDYIKEKRNDEIFEEILSGQLQKSLSLKLKKIYPLGLCEIRIIEVKNTNEKPKEEEKKEIKEQVKEIEENSEKIEKKKKTKKEKKE